MTSLFGLRERKDHLSARAKRRGQDHHRQDLGGTDRARSGRGQSFWDNRWQGSEGDSQENRLSDGERQVLLLAIDRPAEPRPLCLAIRAEGQGQEAAGLRGARRGGAGGGCRHAFPPVFVGNEAEAADGPGAPGQA